MGRFWTLVFVILALLCVRTARADEPCVDDDGKPCKTLDGIFVHANAPPTITFGGFMPYVPLSAVGAGGAGSFQIANNSSSTADKKKSPNPCPDRSGDPITLHDGIKVDLATDFALPGEMGLRFSRYYISKNIHGTPYGGWTNNLDYELISVCAPNFGSCSKLTFMRPDGSTLTFLHSGFDSNGNDTFAEDGGGGLAKATYQGPALLGMSGSYTIVDEDSMVYKFRDNKATGPNALPAGLYSITDVSGIGWSILRPGNGDTTYVTHTSGQSMTLVTSSEGTTSVLTVTDPAGNAYVYKSVAGAGARLGLLPMNLGTVILPGATATTITYKYTTIYSSNPGPLGSYGLSEVDYNGVPHDYTDYDSAGRAYRTRMADGTRTVTVSYGSNGTGTTATVTNALGQVSVNQYDGAGQLISTSGQAAALCAAFFNSNTYDSNGNLSSSKDNNGNITSYVYASTGQLVKQSEGGVTQGGSTTYKRITDITWDPTPGRDRISSITVEGLSKTAYTYNAQNRAASVSVTNLSANGVHNQTITASYAYTLYANGMVHTMSAVHPSPGGSNTDVYTYDALGNLSSVANGLNQAVTYGNYTGLGEPGRITSPNGDIADYTYDARGRVVAVSHIHAGVTNVQTYAYDANSGRVSDVVKPNNEHVHNVYDTAFNLTSSKWTGPSGASITMSYTYDAMGNVKSAVRALQGSTSTVSRYWDYDELGRAIAMRGNHGQKVTLAYDLNGNVASMQDAAGHSTSFQYDALNRRISITDAKGGVTQFEYDQGDHMTKVTDPRGLVTSYAYDGFGQPWTTISPDTETTHYTYDAYGRLSSLTRNGGTSITYAYDSLGRISSESAGGQIHTFTYDSCTYGKGHLCGFSDASGSTAYGYNIEGLVAQRTTTVPLGASTSTYSYDGMNRLVQMADGTTATLTYTWTDDQVSKINVQSLGQSVNVVSSVTYDAMRNLTGFTYGNGIHRTQAYDSDGRLTSIASSGATAIQSLGFSWDNADRVTKITNASYPVMTQDFGYDQLDRLTSTTGPVPLTLYYDANGNRTHQTWTWDQVIGVDPGSNRITHQDGHLYSYDADGNLSANAWGGSTATYTYDPFGRLSSVSRNTAISYCETDGDCPVYPAGTTTYATNALGQRTQKSGPLGFTLYGYDLGGRVTGELSTTNGYNYYIYLGNQPVALLRGNVFYYIHADQLGRPEEITNGSQSAVWIGRNFAFDRSILQEGIPGVDIGFPGQVYDAETGHWHNGFRNYDPSNGKYIESDPIGLSGGLNTYVYVDNNPLSNIDPLGLRALTNCEKDVLKPYIPQQDLDNADLHDGEVPAYLGSGYDGITRGNNIYFRPGVYDPSIPAGIALLGHELVHVGQYRQGMTWVSYLWSTRHGYVNSKYEKPAYAMQAKIQDDLSGNGFSGCGCEK